MNIRYVSGNAEAADKLRVLEAQITDWRKKGCPASKSHHYDIVAVFDWVSEHEEAFQFMPEVTEMIAECASPCDGRSPTRGNEEMEEGQRERSEIRTGNANVNEQPPQGAKSWYDRIVVVAVILLVQNS